MQVEIAKAPFCQSARYAHAEVNRALVHDMTAAEWIEAHLKSHNFRPEFTYSEITLGRGTLGVPRYHHDFCHLLLAIAYKKMGVDTTEFRYWYNGNEYAEAMAINMEGVFYSIVSPSFGLRTEDGYVQLVTNYFSDKKFKKERRRQERVCMIADHSLYPQTAFEICRKGHFEMDYIAKQMDGINKDYDDDDLFTQSPIIDSIRLTLEIDEEHIRQTYRTLKPVFEYLEQVLEPKILTPYPRQELPRMHETLKQIKMRDLWSVISGEPYIRPTLQRENATPSL